MAGIHGLFPAQAVEFIIPPKQNGIPDPVLHFGIPGLGDKRNQPVQVPLRYVEKRVVLDLGTDSGTIDHVVENYLGDSGPQLLVKMLILTIKKEQNPATDNACDTAGIIVFPVAEQSYVALFEIGKIIENDELYLLFKARLEFSFYLLDMFIGVFSSVKGQFPAIHIKIGVKLIKPEMLPQKIVVLNPVLSKGQLRSIVKLTITILWPLKSQKNSGCKQESEKGPPEIL